MFFICCLEAKEAKVLVDLALISSFGQGDFEVQRVTCLHEATMGYEALIFELHPSMGFEEFFTLCQKVWTAYSADPKLPTKLV